MITILLICLIVIDFALLGIVFLMSKRKVDNMEALQEMVEERRLLSELHKSIKEEMDLGRRKTREALDKIATIATEIEVEKKTGGTDLNDQMAVVIAEINQKIEDPIKKLAKKQAAVEQLLRKLDKEKQLLLKAIARAEELTKFFNKDMPYEEVLAEIEDKKYLDARRLLSKGLTPERVALELNLPESEVRLLAAVG